MTDPGDTARHDLFWGSPYSWITPAALFAALMIGLAAAPNAGSRSFYEASTQVIPVIMLTLAIDARAFEWNLEWRGWRDRWERGLDGPVTVAASRVLVLLVLIIAELVALGRIADPGELGAPEPKFVFAAMVAGFAAVALAAVPRRSTRSTSPPAAE